MVCSRGQTVNEDDTVDTGACPVEGLRKGGGVSGNEKEDEEWEENIMSRKWTASLSQSNITSLHAGIVWEKAEFRHQLGHIFSIITSSFVI